MAIYSAARQTTLVTATADAVLCALRGPTSRRAKVLEIGIFYITAPTTSGDIYLTRSTALGTGSRTSTVGKPHDPLNPDSTAELVTAWATLKPTVAGTQVPLRRFACAAAIGNGVIWRFDDGEGLWLADNGVATAELCICNNVAVAPGTFNISVTWME